LRKPVERVFYEDIFISKHKTFNPSGRMHLLVRTLEERPELGQFIHSVSLAHPPLKMFTESGERTSVDEQALLRFFELCTGLQRLVVSAVPVRCIPPNISILAMKYFPGCLPLILFKLPNLTDLYLFQIQSYQPIYDQLAPSHHLRRLRFDSVQQFPNHYFAQVLNFCDDTVEDVYISGHPNVSWVDDPPAIVSTSAGSGIRKMRLNDYFVLANPLSRAAALLQNLPVLQHLHYSGRAPVHVNAFTVLPPTLRSLALSGYAVEIMPETHFKPSSIARGVGNALATSAARSRKIISVTVHGCDVSTPATKIDYSHLQDTCEAEGIPYYRLGQDTDIWDMEIRILCRLLIPYHRIWADSVSVR
jgi:hypothetical protein